MIAADENGEKEVYDGIDSVESYTTTSDTIVILFRITSFH